MLSKLNINNLAIIERLDLDLSQGLTVLTGETGAGKSILLDALSMALGMRADSSLIKFGTNKSVVNAEFNITKLNHVHDWLEYQDLENTNNPNSCFVRRTLNKQGGSNAYINGSQVNIGTLKQLGDMLIDIHGQHEHQSLLTINKQLDLLDAYANLVTDKKRLQSLFKEINELEQSKISMQASRDNILAKQELLSFQLEEINAIDPKPNEYLKLVEEHKLLDNAFNINKGLENAYQIIEKNEFSAVAAIIKANRELINIADTNQTIDDISTRLASIEIDLQDVSSEIIRFIDNFDVDPNNFERVNDRLSAWIGQAKKHNIDPMDLYDKKIAIEQELKLIQAPDIDLEQLNNKLEKAKIEYQELAIFISKLRKKNIDSIEQQVMSTIAELGMTGGEFKINLIKLEHPASYGLEKIEFLVSANKGQPLLPLKKIASGGELSRISLAIQVATAGVVTLPTLIFDEVDVGIGGAVAEIVGKKIAILAKQRQIISITHQPQVAAFCNNHLKVSKSDSYTGTVSKVDYLNTDQQIIEIARMLGGVEITAATIEHAKEMKQNAKTIINSIN